MSIDGPKLNGINGNWHLHKAVPVTIVIALVFQFVYLVRYATEVESSLRAEIRALQVGQGQQDHRLDQLDVIAIKVPIIEERQNVVIRTLEANGKKLDTIIEQHQQLRLPPPPH